MHQVVIQFAIDKTLAPKVALLRQWAQAALKDLKKDVEITLRIVGTEEMTDLNQTYRRKQGPTNVLSFPFAAPDEVAFDETILGDVVICADVVNQEAKQQHKAVNAHWAHMVLHDILHLRGHDHVLEADAEKMEGLEIAMMQSLGFSNPYESGDTIKHYE